MQSKLQQFDDALRHEIVRILPVLLFRLLIYISVHISTRHVP